MAYDFGRTWWGKQWLRALHEIDYSNRLPRGKSYARTGKVASLQIKNNMITAKVRGRRATPYKVMIVVPPFFDNDVARLVDEILEKPMLISKLLNRELDPAILDIAEKLGLKVFPEQWTDLKMQCSCPDWAVPCKHIAAVIYKISQEIDNNPLLVFLMHRVNLLEEMKKRNVDVTGRKKKEIPKFNSLFTLKRGRKTHGFPDEEQAYQRVDLSGINDITETLVRILPEFPAFHIKKDFRIIYGKIIRKIVKKSKRHIKKNIPFVEESLIPQIEKRNVLSVAVTENGPCRVDCKDRIIPDLLSLISALLQISPQLLYDYHPSTAVLHTMAEASLHLLSHGAVTPMIVRRKDKTYMIRWFPTSVDASVRQLLHSCAELPLVPLLYLERKNGKKTTVSEIVPEPADIMSLFLTALIHSLSPDVSDNRFLELFFTGRACSFDGVGEHAFPGGIKVWLDRHHIHNEHFKPVLTVKESPDDNFGVDLSVDYPGTDVPVPLQDVLKNDEFRNNKFEILKTVSLLSPFVEGLDQYINSQTEYPIIFTMERFGSFLKEMLPVIKLLDIRVIMPKSLERIVNPRPTVKIQRKKEKNLSSFITITDILRFDWQVAMGEHVVSREEFERIAETANGLIRFKGGYVYVDHDDIAKITRHFEKTKPMKPMDVLRVAITGEYNGAPVSLTEEVKRAIDDIVSWETRQPPGKITAQLRPYQQRGYSWLYNNTKIGFGSIIADDMGLGKTVQVITLLQKLKDDGQLTSSTPALVIVPTAVLTNWENEIAKFAPDLSSEIYHGPKRNVKKCNSDVILTTYGVIRSDVSVLRKKKWATQIIDEAQNIKNPKTAQSRAVKRIPAQTRVAMSGTPVENRLREFWSIMDFVNKDYLGTAKTFENTFARPIQKYNDENTATKFRKATAPFLLRRLKTDKSIISDLPEKIEIDQYASLKKEQAALYEQTVSEAMDTIEGITDNDQQSLFKRRGLVLQMILALKQICNHPAQFLKTGKKEAGLSGKTDLLMALLETIIDNHEKALIFTQFKEMGSILTDILTEKFGEEPLFYHGGCSIKKRQEMVERFQENHADKLFVLSLKAAGTGLNLTSASHVIHFDLWWNPAVEAQATDRAYRIGQDKNVEVHRFITRHTFEEKIDAMISSKKNLADMTVAAGENWIGQLSNRELDDIFRL